LGHTEGCQKAEAEEAMNWRAWLGLDPARNPMRYLTESDRYRLGARTIIFFLGAALLFLVLKHLGL